MARLATYSMTVDWGTTSTSGTTQVTTVAPVGVSGTWTPTFAEEFSGSSLNTTTWSVLDEFGRRWNTGNASEIEWYDPAAITVSSGTCKLTATRETYTTTPTQLYKSGRIMSRSAFSQTYGFFEARMRMPTAAGTWPAFWLTPVTGWPPEIDILEIFQDGTANFYSTNVHYDPGTGATQSGLTNHSCSISQWHVYGCNWQPGSIKFYLDGALQRTLTTPAPYVNVPMYLVANLAIDSGNSPNSANFPQVMEIDYVRAWSGS